MPRMYVVVMGYSERCQVQGPLVACRSPRLLAPGLPFPQVLALSAAFSQRASVQPALSPAPAPARAPVATYSSGVSGLSLLGTERREVTVKLGARGQGETGTEGYSERAREDSRGGREEEPSCPGYPGSGCPGAPQGWSVQDPEGCTGLPLALAGPLCKGPALALHWAGVGVLPRFRQSQGGGAGGAAAEQDPGARWPRTGQDGRKAG